MLKVLFRQPRRMLRFCLDSHANSRSAQTQSPPSSRGNAKRVYYSGATNFLLLRMLADCRILTALVAKMTNQFNTSAL